MKSISNTLWGIVLIVLGLILGLNATGLIDIDLFFAVQKKAYVNSVVDYF